MPSHRTSLSRKPLTRVPWVKPFKPREINDVSTHVVRAIGVSFGPHRLSDNFRVCTTGKKETGRIARYRRYLNSKNITARFNSNRIRIASVAFATKNKTDGRCDEQ